MKKLLSLLLAALLCLPTLEAKKLHTIGDSTMQTYDETTDKRGWAQMLQQFFDALQITVNNRGKSGASSKSFYREAAYWPTMITGGTDQMQAGDILVIQFAHNDEKSSGTDGDEENALHTTLGDGLSVDYRGTTPFDTYKTQLRNYINEAKAMGVKPILCGPICRKYFTTDGQIRRNGHHDLGDKFNKIENGALLTNQSLPATDHTLDYVYQMQQVAAEYTDVPFIDLTTATAELYMSYGEAYCTSSLFCKDDGTHPAAMGATLIARLFAQLVHEAATGTTMTAAQKAVLLELDSAIVLSSEISFSPASGDLGKTYVGQTVQKEFNVSAFGLNPAAGTVTFTATGGYLLSADKQNFATSVQVAYTGSTLITPIQVRYAANAVGTAAGTITATNGTTQSSLNLTLQVATLGGEAFSVLYPLASNATAVVEGTEAAAAIGETFSNMEVKQYGAIDTGKESMQLVQISGQAADGSWPAGEIDEVSTRYFQFAVQCPEGKKMTVTSLGLHLAGRGGNGMCAKAYYSTDATFATNTQIFEQSNMVNKQVYPISAATALTLEEGERVYIRVYPWYNSGVTGKWICVDSVYIKGQIENAGGVEITGQIIYGLHAGGTDQQPSFDPETMQAGFAGKTISAGSALTVSGTTNWSGTTGNGTVMTNVKNNSGSSWAAAPDANNTLTFTITPDDGFFFTPDTISFCAAKFGTDGGTVTAIASVGENSVTLCTSEAVNRGGKSLELKQISGAVSGLVAEASAPLLLKISFLGLGNTKTMGISDLAIHGKLQGAAAQTVKHTLTTQVLPAEGGSITRDPELAQYKEGSAVTLTASRNFGYAFSGWQDEAGNTLSTDATYAVTMDADKTVKAVFTAIPVYTVTTACTNDAERTLGSITLTPNEHDSRYEAGTQITAKANGSKILNFMSWTDSFENAGTTNPRTLTVNSDMSLVANFEVQDFIAVFDASRVQAYADRGSYPFAADLTWDEQRNATACIVRVDSGTVLTGIGSTPVVRNREGVVLTGLNGLYQNGYNTTEIAWQYQFSTIGFTSARIEGQQAAKNAATVNWKAQYSLDGTTYTDIPSAAWSVTANVIKDVAFDLPAACVGQPAVYVRFTGTGTEVHNTSYPFNKTATDGMSYCDHSESGFGNLYVLGEAVVEADTEAPVLTATLPANNATNVSASGKITFTYNERIVYGAGEATLAGNGETKSLNPTWNARSVSFDYVSLAYGATYTISLPAGYVQDKSNNAAAAATLTFTVMNRQAPAARTFDAVVDATLALEHGQSIAATADMPAQYRYIQDAINAAPANGTAPYLIYIREGYYRDPNWTFSDSYGNRIEGGVTRNDVAAGINEYDSCRLVWVNKPNIHLIGQDLEKVTIATDRLAGSTGSADRVWYHVNAGATIIVTENGKGFHMENITVDNENWTINQMAGPQALCLRVRSDKTVFNNVNVRSYQDSYYSASGYNRQFWYGSTIEGAVDFIYGDGEVFFEGCTLNINRKEGGYIVAPNHKRESTRWGYVFNNTRITTTYASDPSTYKIYFGRPWHDHPKTVFLHTQCEVTPYAGYWYTTMGGLPDLWAVYDIWDKNGNRMSETSISEYFYTEGGVEHRDTAKNYLTAEEAAQYTIDNCMAGDGTSNSETGVWNPLEVIEKTAAPVLSEANGTITWPACSYAICYVVTVNGKAVAFPTEPEYTAQQGDIVTVQSVNEFGSLSVPSEAITVGGATSVDKAQCTPEGLMRSEKIIRDGRLYILRDGVTYDILGSLVR